MLPRPVLGTLPPRWVPGAQPPLRGYFLSSSWCETREASEGSFCNARPKAEFWLLVFTFCNLAAASKTLLRSSGDTGFSIFIGRALEFHPVIGGLLLAFGKQSIQFRSFLPVQFSF